MGSETVKPLFSELMNTRLSQSGHTRKTLAAELNRSPEHIRKLLGGETVPGPDLTARIAEVLDIDPAKFSDAVNQEKWIRKTGKKPPHTEALPIPHLQKLWPRLSGQQRTLLTCVAKCLLAKSS